MSIERVEIGLCTLYRGDCLEIAPTISGIDALISDPPYGMARNGDSGRFSGGHRNHRGRRMAGPDRGAIVGDDKPFDPAPWIDYPRAILWGCNHFGQRLPVGTTLVWIKRLDDGFGSFLSDAELAWMKGGHGVYCRRDLSNYSKTATWTHPCQKPVGIMEWCIEKSKDAETIFDPYMGSGTTGVAAIRMGRRFIGCEIDPKYFSLACDRIREADRLKRSELPMTPKPSFRQCDLFPQAV